MADPSSEAANCQPVSIAPLLEAYGVPSTNYVDRKGRNLDAQFGLSTHG